MRFWLERRRVLDMRFRLWLGLRLGLICGLRCRLRLGLRLRLRGGLGLRQRYRVDWILQRCAAVGAEV